MKRLLAHYIWFTHRHIFFSGLIIYSVVIIAQQLITGSTSPLVALTIQLAATLPIALSEKVVDWGWSNRS